MTEQYAPPAKPCYWQVLEKRGLRMDIVGPCKTAFDAWKLTRLKGGFGDYDYEPILER